MLSEIICSQTPEMGSHKCRFVAEPSDSTEKAFAYSVFSAPAPLKKGFCFGVNERQCEWPNSCQYKHECLLLWCSSSFSLLQTLALPEAATPVKLVEMLPFLQTWLNRQTEDLLFKGFNFGFQLPFFFLFCHRLPLF